jgi:Tfp pilus assembly protein PilX
MELGKINKKDKAGQQEIIGFVLIVVLVLVAVMVFLIIAIKSPFVF